MAKAKPKAPAPEPAEDAGAQLLERMEMADDPETRATDPAHYARSEPTPAPAPPPAPKHPAWLTRKGEAAGLSADEMAGMSADEVKEAIFVTGERTDLNRAATRFNAAGQPINDQGQFVARAPQPTAPPPAPREFDLLQDLGVDERKWGENTTTSQILKEVIAPLHKRIGELEAALNGVGERERLRDANAHYDRLDKLFAKDEATFGQGSRYELEPSSSEFAKRQSVIQRMTALHQADPNTPLPKLYAQAVKDLGYTKAPASPPPPPVEDPLGFANGHVGAPRARMTQARPKGVKNATAVVAEILEERARNETTSEADELPG